jgi:hypothetical protein
MHAQPYAELHVKLMHTILPNRVLRMQKLFYLTFLIFVGVSG